MATSVSRRLVLAFYPTQGQTEKLGTARTPNWSSKRPPNLLQWTFRCKAGNTGVVVQTTTKEAAEKLKKAAPMTLRVEVPKSKPPQVVLRNLEGNPDGREVLTALYEQNLKGSS